MEIKIKRISATAKVPTRGSEHAAGYDLYADIPANLTIYPNETKLIPTGIAMEIPEGYFGAIYPRSGLALKQGLRLANSVAIIDEDYRGVVGIALHNDSDTVRVIEPAERIAQIVFQPYLEASFLEVDELSNTERGDGGFGHSGTKWGVNYV